MVFVVLALSSLFQLATLWLIWKLSDRASYKAADAAETAEVVHQSVWKLEQRIFKMEQVLERLK